MMADVSKRTPSGEHAGFVKGVNVRAQQSKGRGRRPAEELLMEPLRIWEFRRCSDAD